MPYLNTSHVKVNLTSIKIVRGGLFYLNTSHVKVNRSWISTLLYR